MVSSRVVRGFWAGLCGALLVALSACGDGTQTKAASSSTGTANEIVLNRGNGPEPKSLDPGLTDGIWEAQILGDMLLGLTTEDAESKPIPGAAESWETSEDGLTWTFHLRDHTWSDGVPVTADDFVFAWRRVLDPKTAAPYAYYLYPIKNARDVSSGKQPATALGVEAKDARTLVVTLDHPLPFMTEYLTHQSMFPVPRHVVEAKGAEWARPGNFVSNGAYVLEGWTPNDRVTLRKNPRFYDAANVQIEIVNYFATPDGDAALRRLRAGELDTQDPIPPSQVDFLRANMADALKIAPTLTTSYLSINLTHKPLDDVRIREALNLAVEREILVDRIIKLGDLPAYNLIPPGTANYPGGVAMPFKAMPYEQRVARAQELMRAAGYTPERPLRIRWMTTTNAVTRQTIAPLQEMWRKIYVDVEIVQTDTQINYQKLEDGDFDIGTAGWIADYNDASNFLDVLRTGGGNNYGRYGNPKFDALLDQAAIERDLAKRGQLLAQAEQMMLDEYPLVLVRFQTQPTIVQPYVKGWIPSSKQINRTRWLTVEKGLPE
jgi:oligopeptide transport system substrate-binding protein